MRFFIMQSTVSIIIVTRYAITVRIIGNGKIWLNGNVVARSVERETKPTDKATSLSIASIPYIIYRCFPSPLINSYNESLFAGSFVAIAVFSAPSITTRWESLGVVVWITVPVPSSVSYFLCHKYPSQKATAYIGIQHKYIGVESSAWSSSWKIPLRMGNDTK